MGTSVDIGIMLQQCGQWTIYSWRSCGRILRGLAKYVLDTSRANLIIESMLPPEHHAYQSTAREIKVFCSPDWHDCTFSRYWRPPSHPPYAPSQFSLGIFEVSHSNVPRTKYVKLHYQFYRVDSQYMQCSLFNAPKSQSSPPLSCLKHIFCHELSPS